MTTQQNELEHWRKYIKRAEQWREYFRNKADSRALALFESEVRAAKKALAELEKENGNVNPA